MSPFGSAVWPDRGNIYTIVFLYFIDNLIILNIYRVDDKETFYAVYFLIPRNLRNGNFIAYVAMSINMQLKDNIRRRRLNLTF